MSVLTLCAASFFTSTQAPSTWDWQPALALQQPWRSVTGALVHWSPQHLGLNLMGAALVGLLGWRSGVTLRDSLAWLLSWPLTHWGLMLQPELLHYGGLSGVLHGGAAIAAWRLSRQADARQRWVGRLLGAGLVLKCLSETPWQGALQRVEGFDFALAPLAHSSGVLSAGLMLLLLNLPAAVASLSSSSSSSDPSAPAHDRPTRPS
ncbi:rhombosortase [Ideonella paludis]|uniref:Rhombosortase n=1 Tax=Ideonella paludis TaxID=1233411 RepID=A0ABS5DSZ4_9BURK|nr:rhombosortase [Ideonella paludis]MBQ0934269.1 rhombosortase [Ideonella paludis]